MGLVAATWLLFRVHLARVAWSKRSLICVLLALLPTLCAWIVTSFSTRVPPVDLATHLGFLLMLQVILPVLTLIAGSAAVAEELEDRTATFLFSRPIPRAAVLFGRWAASLVFVTVVLGLATGAMLLVCTRAQGKGDPLDADVATSLVLGVLAGGAVYSALFAVLGVLVRHPMIVGLAYAFAVEGFLANLPGRNQALTIQFHLRSLIAHGGSDAWNRVEGFSAPNFDTVEGAWIRLGAVLCLTLALGAWRISRREFLLGA